jgi:acetyl esterase/lipase
MKRQCHVIAALLLTVLPACSRPSPLFDPARYGTIERDIPYCFVDGVPLLMDVHFPAEGGPWPVIVFVHGGGWTGGDKAQVDGGLTEYGYLVVTVNYRLYPEARFPAMIEDVKCAIRSLRAHAGEYNLDPDHIGLTGGSAGGHLVALAATADESAGFDLGEYLEHSSRVQAVQVVAGPSDLTLSFPDWADSTLRDVFGEEQLAAASPVTYISRDDPPFLIFHGEVDRVVPLEQAIVLHDRLVEAGIASQLVIIENADHGLNAIDGPISPDWEELLQISLDFWKATLR